MQRVGYVFDPAFLNHEMGAGHPESPDRLRAIHNHLRSSGLLRQLIQIAPKEASRQWIANIHESAYIHRLESQSPTTGYASLDPDTSLSPGSLSAAYLAAGGAMTAVDHIMAGQADRVFCAVRPPGHHAEANQAMGFCFFNNIAIATRYAQERHGLKRVLIVDWDVHHGNGTQHVFEEDPSVLFFSTHQYPHYPGSGRATERGKGAGEGLTINVPMVAGEGNAEYQEVFENVLVPAADSFQPDIIMISAGFDAHQDDPLASMRITDQGYRELSNIVTRIANRHAAGRIVSCLEGGYHLPALATSVEQHLIALCENA
ncbi:MAG: histone deacetylase [Nitrospirales bacterium]|nr:histone deacetylase [Nitrospirales bacterium]